MKVSPLLPVVLLLVFPALGAHGFTELPKGLDGGKEGTIQSITITEEPSQGKTIVLKTPAKIEAFVQLFSGWTGNNTGLIRTYMTLTTTGTDSSVKVLRSFLKDRPACYVITIELKVGPYARYGAPNTAAPKTSAYTLYITPEWEKGAIWPKLWIMDADGRLSEYRRGPGRNVRDPATSAEIALEEMFRQVREGTTSQ